MRVAVTGGNGVLGRALRAIRPDWVYLSRADLDVRDAVATRGTLMLTRPDVLIHAAALTDHQHPNAAEVIATNIVGTANVMAAARALCIPVVYTSTHYVYAGRDGNYDERSVPEPIGAYAWSKWAAEQWVRARQPLSSLIVRGSWYTHETRLDKWAERGALVDAWCGREPVTAAARKIVALVEARVRGVVNIGGARRSFAQILQDEGYEEFPTLTRQVASDFAVLKTPYAFPADVSVSTAKFDALRLVLP